MASSNPQQQTSTMSSSPPLVWFQLVDFATGKPYKDTSVSSVLRSSFVVPVVDQFRKAVKAEHTNKLSSMDAADLLVYKNKTAFNKRNADEGKEEPLEEDSLVDGLGTTKKEALVVVVPSSIQSGPSSFPICKIPFFNSVINATEIDGWISFGQVIPSTTLNKLYIR